MNMCNPPHPAEIIRDDILPELGLTVTQAAKQLGVNRVTLSRLLNGKASISADMALRLHLWLGEDSPSAESWLHQQADYDLWKAAQNMNFTVIPAIPSSSFAERTSFTANSVTDKVNSKK